MIWIYRVIIALGLFLTAFALTQGVVLLLRVRP